VKVVAELYKLGALAEAMAALARMVVAKARLNLSDFEQMGAARLCKLAMAAKRKMGGFEWTVAGLCGLMMAVILCGLAVLVLLNLAVLVCAAAVRHYGLAMAVGLCKLEVQVVAMAGLRLGRCGWMVAKHGLVGFELVGVVVQAGAGFEVETGWVAPPPCHPHWKTSHRHLSQVHVAKRCGCWSYAGLDSCEASIVAMRLVRVRVKAGAWVRFRGWLGSGGRIACTKQRRRGRRGNGPTCLLSVDRAPGHPPASSVARLQLQWLHLQVSTGQR